MPQITEKKYKIAILYFGFMEEYLDYFLSYCEENNIIVDIITSRQDIEIKHKINKIIDFNIEPNVKSPFDIIKLDRKIKKLTKSENYDYILTDTFSLSNTVSVLHSPSINKRCQISPNIIYKLVHFIGHMHKIIFNHFFYKNCPKMFAVSSIMKDDYTKSYNLPPEKVAVIYPGFQFNNTLQTSKKNNDNFVIGMSGNGFVTKGGYILLNAIKELRKKHKNIKARIIYARNKTNLGLKLYLKFWNLEENVELLGFQDDMTDFYQSLDCLVCPSLCEAFGRVVTEAMNFKVPVIVSSTTGAKDIIKENENGFIFERQGYSGKNLANKIEYIMEHQQLIPSVTDKAYTTAQKMTWEKFAKDMFYNLYPELTSSFTHE